MMFTSPSVPPNVVSAVRGRWPERAEEWSRRVESELHELCARHRATPRRVLSARYGFVVAVNTVHGGLVMRASPDPMGPFQARVAATLAELGVSPAVHETIDTDTGTWMILDEVRPATPLADFDEPLVMLESLAAPLVAMKELPAPVFGMPSIVDWLRGRLREDNPTDVPPRANWVTAPVRRAAARVLDDLARDTTPQLCHGDVSPWNVLAHGENGWMLIDPRGMSGEVSYDVAVLSLKIAPQQSAGSVTGRLAKTVGVDPMRARAWLAVADAARV